MNIPSIFTKKTLLYTAWIIFCTVVSVSLYKTYKSSIGGVERVKQLEKRTIDLEKEIAVLKDQVELAKDPFVRERMIREELGMQLPNEIIVQVAEPLATIAGTMDPVEPSMQEQSIFEQISTFLDSLASRLASFFR
jgi:cell division protein FtsB